METFEAGAKPTAAAETTDLNTMLSRPDREYAVVHQVGPEYKPGEGQSPDDVGRAYLRDGLISPLVADKALPPTVTDTGLGAALTTLHTRLVAQEEQLAKWNSDPRLMGSPPVNPQQLRQQVYGFLRATALQRRYGEAEREARRAFEASQAEAQELFAERQANAPRVEVAVTPDQLAEMNKDPQYKADVLASIDAVNERLRARDEQEVEDGRRARQNLSSL